MSKKQCIVRKKHYELVVIKPSFLQIYKVVLQLLLPELLSTEAVAMGAENHCHTYIH